MIGRCRRSRRVAGTTLWIAIAASAACGRDRSDPVALSRVHVQSNGVIPNTDALPVRLQPLDEPALDRLAAREHLRELVAGIPRQFDQIERVQDWVNAQWPDGTPDPAPPWDALTVLDWIRSGKTGGACGQYALVFLQSLAALGFSARYVETGSDENPYVHFVTEVWSNDFDKWVLMDADYDVHFEREGIPLSALEVHDAFVSSAMARTAAIFPEGRPGHATPSMWPDRTARFYYYLRYHLNANHLSSPDDPPFDRFGDMIEFADPRTPGWEDSPAASAFPKERLTRRRITDPAMASARLNQVEIAIRSAADDAVTIRLRDNVLQRASYEYRVTENGMPPGGWQSTGQATLTLRMPDNGGLVQVRGVNIRGIAGPTSTVSIDPVSR